VKLTDADGMKLNRGHMGQDGEIRERYTRLEDCLNQNALDQTITQYSISTQRRNLKLQTKWHIRRYKKGDEQGIINLMKLEYGRNAELMLEKWEWQCKNNPFGCLVAVAEERGTIVGHMALVPVLMKIENMIVRAAQAVDLVVHPDFRRQGIFQALERELKGNAIEEEIAISFAFPTKGDASHLGFLKIGWVDICNIPLLVKPLDTYKMLSRHFANKYGTIKTMNEHKISRNVAKLFVHLAALLVGFIMTISPRRKDRFVSVGSHIREVSTLDESLNDFWEGVCSNHNVIMVRDKEHLNWRYFQKPTKEYVVLLAKDGCRIQGYLVLTCKNGRSGYIVDMLSYSDRSVIQCLVSEAIRYFTEKKIDSIRCLMSRNSPYYEILRDNGFMVFPSNQMLTVHVNSPRVSTEYVKDPNNWYIAAGDSDHV